MTDLFSNLSTEEIEVTFEPYKPTDHYLLTIDTLLVNHSFVISAEQLVQLRAVLNTLTSKCSQCEKMLKEEKAYSRYNESSDKFDLLCTNCATKSI